MEPFYAAVIAGTHSSVGKTTWSLALMSYFAKKGRQVQPFKVGPDYIDPSFHHKVCHPRKSRNLDRFFLSEEYLKRSFSRHSIGSDLSLVEGVMGLFDGRSTMTEEGSTAQMAKLLGLPVFLVIDGSGLARSAAALVKGYQNFDTELNLRGVLINRISSEGHYRWLREPIEKETGLPVLGWLPEDKNISIPERHLGLRTASEEDFIEKKLGELGNLLEGRLDEVRFLKLCRRDRPAPASSPRPEFYKKCRVGVARDRAFSFYYEDNLDLLEEAGAELIFFSPLNDASLPEVLDALYLGGGFPELYAEELNRNGSLKVSLREFVQAGGLIYAECGGLIYLAESLEDGKGNRLPMVGLLPGTIRMTSRLQNFGYHEIGTRFSTFLFREGEKLRSHEFHYSTWEIHGDPSSPYQIQGRLEGYYDGRILASYQHLHFGQDPNLAQNFVTAATCRRSYVHGG